MGYIITHIQNIDQFNKAQKFLKEKYPEISLIDDYPWYSEFYIRSCYDTHVYYGRMSYLSTMLSEYSSIRYNIISIHDLDKHRSKRSFLEEHNNRLKEDTK